MRISKWTASLCLLLLTGCAGKQQSTAFGQPTLLKAPAPPMTLSTGWQLQDTAKVPEPGEIVSKPDYTPAQWYKATVPGTVLTTLVNEGVYPEPLYGENNRPDKIPESLCRTSYWYRNVLTIPNRAADERTWLNFDGINYIAEIWVNGRQAGRVRGAFARGIFDITDYVTPGQPTAVAVKILPPPTPGNPQEQTQALGTGGNGGIHTQDGATFLSSQGWDWIPAIRDRNMGIWQKVWVSHTGPVRVEHPLVVTDLPLPKIDSADLTVTATVRNVTDQLCEGRLIGSIGDVTFEQPVTLQPNESRLVKFSPDTTPNLRFNQPKLWWPNTYGDPNLYTLNLKFAVNAAAGQARGPSVSDSQDINFGIREFEYKLPGSDNLAIRINGVPVICKGGNWGIDEAMKRTPRDRLEAQIRLHREANYTMVRNWVGQTTQADFYDLCDRYGIMIWDEFFQPNPSDGPNPTDPVMYLENVREKVLRFRHHASIALWCGRNEGDPPPNINAGIQKIMDELEPARLYQQNSNDGRGVRSGGPYAWRQPGQYYTFQPAESFKTEIGPVSIPTLQSVQGMLEPKDWNTFNDAWASHDLLRGAQMNRQSMYWDVIAERYGKFTDLDGFVRRAQLANYEAYRAMYEGRFAKLFQPVTGVLTWMSNPAQPSTVWQIYSYDLESHASLFATKKACEPLHVQMNQNDYRVTVVNTQPTPADNLRVRLRVFDMDGTAKLDQERSVSAAPSRATDTGVIEWPSDLSEVHFIKLEMFDQQNRLVSDNFYWRTLKTFAPATAPATASTRPRQPQPPREDFTKLQSLPNVPINVTSTRQDRDGRTTIKATVTNKGSAVALLVHLQLRKANKTDRVLPVYYSDNYVSLLPGESKQISIDASTADVGSATPNLWVDGWNVASPENAG
ncbi:MAG TPA: glycoside hydrolase family 2 protein [Tepidisphaeraceae bacterium]|jgi:beta-mannosidase